MYEKIFCVKAYSNIIYSKFLNGQFIVEFGGKYFRAASYEPSTVLTHYLN
jgi:hypothetical protein